MVSKNIIYNRIFKINVSCTDFGRPTVLNRNKTGIPFLPENKNNLNTR